jgi:hypothetical protein
MALSGEPAPDRETRELAAVTTRPACASRTTDCVSRRMAASSCSASRRASSSSNRVWGGKASCGLRRRTATPSLSPARTSRPRRRCRPSLRCASSESCSSRTAESMAGCADCADSSSPRARGARFAPGRSTRGSIRRICATCVPTCQYGQRPRRSGAWARLREWRVARRASRFDALRLLRTRHASQARSRCAPAN